MAEIVVAVAGEALAAGVVKLSEIVIDEANSLRNVKGEISGLEKDLRWMQCFLQDAENKLGGDGSNRIRQWVSDVTDLAYDAEDIIDTFLIKLGSETRGDTCKGCFPIFTRLCDTHKLASEIQDLKKKANGILTRRTEYGLNDLGSSSNRSMANEQLKKLRESSSNPYNEYVVGRAKDVDHLLKELRDGESGRFMVCIIGMGGLGKTTIARKLYNELAPERFHYRAWICVSQSYNADDLLLQLIIQMIHPDKKVLKELTSRTLRKDYLRNNLGKSSFLVVLDDVWDKAAWESVSDAFPNDSTNGRVIITTRKSEVANANPAYVHNLKGLDYEDSWELFCRNTFQYDKSKECPSYLKQLGEDMVRKCDGLPLAILTLSGLLSTKSNNISGWEAVKDNIWEELGKKNSSHRRSPVT